MVALAVAHPRQGDPASAPARVVRLTTEALEVWSVERSGGGGGGVGGGGAASLEVRQPLTGQFQRSLGVIEKVCLVDVAVVGAAGAGAGASPGGPGGAGAGSESSASAPSVANWGLDLLVLAVAGPGPAAAAGGGGEGAQFSVHAVRVSSEEASWVGSSVSVKVGVGGVLKRLAALRVCCYCFLFSLCRERVFSHPSLARSLGYCGLVLSMYCSFFYKSRVIRLVSC